jgi:hypothetical protein
MLSKEISSLQDLSQKCTSEAGAIKGNALRKFHYDWNDTQVKLAYPGRKQQQCLFTEDIDAFYGIVLAQIPKNDVKSLLKNNSIP